MQFKLAIADVIELPIKATINDDGKAAVFTFHLRAQRLPQAELRTLLQDQDLQTRDFLVARVTGWRGQRLVLDDAGEPAAFSPDAFDCLLSVVGMESIVFGAYLRAMGAEAPAEKAKN